jgi:hypothetical protein
MTEITYTYEIVRVDPDNKAMDIQYTSPQYGSILVGARMPWADETVEDIVRSFEPVRYWIEQTLNVAPVAQGSTGTVQISTAPDAAAPRSVSKLALVRTMRDTDYDEAQSLWDVAKAQLAMADEATQEDWQLAAVIQEDDPVFVAMATTLYGAEAPARIAALFTAAGAT